MYLRQQGREREEALFEGYEKDNRLHGGAPTPTRHPGEGHTHCALGDPHTQACSSRHRVSLCPSILQGYPSAPQTHCSVPPPLNPGAHCSMPKLTSGSTGRPSLQATPPDLAKLSFICVREGVCGCTLSMSRAQEGGAEATEWPQRGEHRDHSGGGMWVWGAFVSMQTLGGCGSALPSCQLACEL